MKYKFEIKKDLSIYQQREILLFLIEHLTKKNSLVIDDTIDVIPNAIKRHLVKIKI